MTNKLSNNLLIVITILVLTFCILFICCCSHREKYSGKLYLEPVYPEDPKLPKSYGNMIISGLPGRDALIRQVDDKCVISGFESCNNVKSSFRMMFNSDKPYNIKAKVRGHSSSTWEKFGITLHLEDKTSLDPVFRPSKKYILYAPYFELARILNPVTYFVCNQMGLNAPVMMPIQLWVDETESSWPNTTSEWNKIAETNITKQTAKCANGSTVTVQGGDSGYRGLYMLSSPVDDHLLGLTDGDFLIEWDRGDCPKDEDTILNNYTPWDTRDYVGSRPLMQFPDPDKEENEKLGRLLTDFVDRLFGPKPTEFNIPNDGEPEDQSVLNMIDFESWAKYFIISELAKSVDGWMFSTYMYVKSVNGQYKIFMGPPWDYNEAYSTCASFDVCRDGGNVNTWIYATQYLWWSPDKIKFGMPQIISRLMCFGKWRQYLFETYKGLRTSVLSNDNLYSVVDKFAELTRPIVNFDAQRWPNRLGWNYYSGNTGFYTDAVNMFKYWINKRLAWMDANMRDGPAVDDYSGTNWKSLYSWPVCKFNSKGQCSNIQGGFPEGSYTKNSDGTEKPAFKQMSTGVFKAWWPYVRSDKDHPLDKPVW